MRSELLNVCGVPARTFPVASFTCNSRPSSCPDMPQPVARALGVQPVIDLDLRERAYIQAEGDYVRTTVILVCLPDGGE